MSSRKIISPWRSQQLDIPGLVFEEVPKMLVAEPESEVKIEEGSWVVRRRGSLVKGQVISINQYNKCYVRWEEMASTGQWHSTVDIKSLKANNG